MSTPKVKPIPEGMHSLTPHLVCAGAAAAIEFYKKAFNATGDGFLPTPNGKVMHAEIRIGNSALMLMDECPEMGGGSAPSRSKAHPSPSTCMLKTSMPW